MSWIFSSIFLAILLFTTIFRLSDPVLLSFMSETFYSLIAAGARKKGKLTKWQPFTLSLYHQLRLRLSLCGYHRASW